MGFWIGTKRTSRQLRQLAELTGLSEDEALIYALDAALAERRIRTSNPDELNADHSTDVARPD
ncbi:MAG: hypothetical protein K0R83_137 [Caulobacter sp.]|jgi:hypothetical protein|nr:hypothetical protein [Caulobacter sp.]